MEGRGEVAAEICELQLEPSGLLHTWLGRDGSFIKMAGQKGLKEKAKQHTRLTHRHAVSEADQKITHTP